MSPGTSRLKPNGTATSTTIVPWMVSGTTSLRARPTSSALRDSGATRVRSCEPVCISKSRFAPVEAVPNSATITRMPGTNHCKRARDVAAGGADEQRSEQPEEHEGLHEREDHAERVAHERARLADEHGGRVAHESRGAGGGVDGGHEIAPSVRR